MIKNSGELSIDFADDANVPVNIFISEVEEGDYDEDDQPDWATHVLTASNFMPRKGRVASNTHLVFADNEEELRTLVQRHVVPIYEQALERLKTKSTLYYWTNEF